MTQWKKKLPQVSGAALYLLQPVHTSDSLQLAPEMCSSAPGAAADK